MPRSKAWTRGWESAMFGNRNGFRPRFRFGTSGFTRGWNAFIRGMRKQRRLFRKLGLD